MVRCGPWNEVLADRLRECKNLAMECRHGGDGRAYHIPKII